MAKKPIKKHKFKKPSNDDLKKSLSDLSYKITQENLTEKPFSSEYNQNFKPGIYIDIVSKEPLFSSKDKFESGCGWPSFSKPITDKVLIYKNDNSHNMHRIEVRSKLADSHLGHVFKDGKLEFGGLRYCINGAALEFIPLNEMENKGYSEYIKFVE